MLQVLRLGLTKHTGNARLGAGALGAPGAHTPGQHATTRPAGGGCGSGEVLASWQLPHPIPTRLPKSSYVYFGAHGDPGQQTNVPRPLQVGDFLQRAKYSLRPLAHPCTSTGVRPAPWGAAIALAKSSPFQILPDGQDTLTPPWNYAKTHPCPACARGDLGPPQSARAPTPVTKHKHKGPAAAPTHANLQHVIARGGYGGGGGAVLERLVTAREPHAAQERARERARQLDRAPPVRPVQLLEPRRLAVDRVHAHQSQVARDGRVKQERVRDPEGPRVRAVRPPQARVGVHREQDQVRAGAKQRPVGVRTRGPSGSRTAVLGCASLRAYVRRALCAHACVCMHVRTQCTCVPHPA